MSDGMGDSLSGEKGGDLPTYGEDRRKRYKVYFFQCGKTEACRTLELFEINPYEVLKSSLVFFQEMPDDLEDIKIQELP